MVTCDHPLSQKADCRNYQDSFVAIRAVDEYAPARNGEVARLRDGGIGAQRTAVVASSPRIPRTMKVIAGGPFRRPKQARRREYAHRDGGVICPPDTERRQRRRP